MKKINVCILLSAVLILTACSMPKLNNLISQSTADNDISKGDVSVVEYEPSQKTTYEDNNKGDNLYQIVSGNDYVVNPWINDISEGETKTTSEKNSEIFLSVPTWFDYYDGLYFFVDCYHDQIIFNDNLDDPIYMWKVMDNTLARPHTIACDGEVYMVDDTEENRIIVYQKNVGSDGGVYFERIQEFVDMGEQPHYIYYDAATEKFYGWSSKSGQMWVFKRSKDDKKVFLDESYNIPALKDVYVRSFTFCDDKAYFVSGVGGSCSIFETTTDTFDVLREIPVAPEIGGMVQMIKIQDYYYITVSTSLYGEQELRNIIRTDSLDHLQVTQYESLYDELIGTEYPGTPYNITYVNGEYCISVHREGLGAPVVHFQVEDNQIVNVGTYY